MKHLLIVVAIVIALIILFILLESIFSKKPRCPMCNSDEVVEYNENDFICNKCHHHWLLADDGTPIGA